MVNFNISSNRFSSILKSKKANGLICLILIIAVIAVIGYNLLPTVKNALDNRGKKMIETDYYNSDDTLIQEVK
ncbi:hypothetical protein [Senegalia massiliensis]|uniref:Uncharacterized protein n=1 Tax=Senegalia massiliensis TaxID=1720316 RepID=A0A845QYM4_9CLOT|nr:hypothetical protein [Senegalia massiliensis]NBI07585.1 hypothetical protein [Senegalia massiliensis]